MRLLATALLALGVATACASEVAPATAPGDAPAACSIDDDCLSGVECENAWCRDGLCRRGTASGLRCGDAGMCVDSNCIEL